MGEDDDFNKPISFGFSDALRDADNIVKDEEKRKNAELGRLSTIFGQRIGKVSKEFLMKARNSGETKVVFELTPSFPEVTSKGDGGSGALYLDISEINELSPAQGGWRDHFIIKIDEDEAEKMNGGLVPGVVPHSLTKNKYLSNLDHHISAIKIWQSKNLDVINSISIKELCDNTANLIMKAESGFEVSIEIKSIDPTTKKFEPFTPPTYQRYTNLLSEMALIERQMIYHLHRCLFFEITIDFSSYKEVKSLSEGSEQGDVFNNDNGDGSFEGLGSLFG